jgi:hypothetical protein
LKPSVKAPAPVPQPVCNRAAAKAPEAGFAQCKTPEERVAYIQQHY